MSLPWDFVCAPLVCWRLLVAHCLHSLPALLTLPLSLSLSFCTLQYAEDVLEAGQGGKAKQELALLSALLAIKPQASAWAFEGSFRPSISP